MGTTALTTTLIVLASTVLLLTLLVGALSAVIWRMRERLGEDPLFQGGPGCPCVRGPPETINDRLVTLAELGLSRSVEANLDATKQSVANNERVIGMIAKLNEKDVELGQSGMDRAVAATPPPPTPVASAKKNPPTLVIDDDGLAVPVDAAYPDG